MEGRLWALNRVPPLPDERDVASKLRTKYGRTTMKILKSAALVVASTLISFSAQAAETHNMTSEFGTTTNPTGVWTYGHYGDEGAGSLDKSTFQPFTLQVGLPADLSGLAQCDGSSGNLIGWRDETDPNVIKNTGTTTFCGGFSGITFHAGAVTFGPHNGPAVARFTVPGAGDWLVVKWRVGY